MKTIFPIISIILLITSCSSVPRFTKDVKDSSTRYSSSLIMSGIASYYADEFHGRKTSNGETYDMYKLTAAHRDLPFNTKVKITNLKNNKSVIVRINDRMPNFKNRLIDLSYGAAKQIDMLADGITEVKIEILK